MGGSGSALRCCPAGCKRQRKAQQQQGAPGQELSAWRTENANGAGKELAALGEERGAKAVKLLQGQEEEERLRGAQGAEDEGLRGVSTQVEKEKDLELKERLDALRREHKETLKELQRVHEQEKLLLTETHHRSQEALQCSSDPPCAPQEHGSPSPFWEQELESLHFVIEMKNEHIHGLDKKLLNLESVAERNLLLEEKVKTLQQENEDLQVRTQNHLVMTRQLSEELLATRGALEKESKLREQAHREKEELLYRVLNGGDGRPFPIAAGDVPLIAT
ncbi:hypothetical protein ASZ78_003351 [Callipepla squamata]|uniref:Coiled-coil domain-containing protein 69 n=1 Tax=Callipepla squamata TaxID=9009 RepID=A0A226MG93_CALSU|nr:hypothetical protein ASZ78_003351 [Callipepla squamata]